MSRIDDLIAELCPDGVEFKPLGVAGKFIRGSGLQKSQLASEGTPAIHYGEVHTHYGTWAAETKSFVPGDLAAKLRRAKTGDLIIATTSEDDAAVAKATAWPGGDEVAVSGDAYIYHHTLNPKYVSYFFQSTSFQDQKIRHVTGAKVRRISGDSLAKILIPVPPLEVQREIVRVLDKFTQLEAELEAELEARRRQYAYWRKQCFTLISGDFKTVPIGEVFELRAGKFIAANLVVKKPDLKHAIPCFGGGGLRGYVSAANQEGERVLIGRQGALCGNVKRTSGKFYATEHAVVVSPKGNIDISWGFHLLSEMNLNQYASKSAQPGLSVSKLNQLPIRVPPSSVQRRIGEILDRFDALVNDLSSGLPAEITARRKQYEHYRDRLLTFEEKR